jgi:hypothetical protein
MFLKIPNLMKFNPDMNSPRAGVYHENKKTNSRNSKTSSGLSIEGRRSCVLKKKGENKSHD